MQGGEMAKMEPLDEDFEYGRNVPMHAEGAEMAKIEPLDEDFEHGDVPQQDTTAKMARMEPPIYEDYEYGKLSYRNCARSAEMEASFDEDYEEPTDMYKKPYNWRLYAPDGRNCVSRAKTCFV
jgi:hypothetical protein